MKNVRMCVLMTLVVLAFGMAPQAKAENTGDGTAIGVQFGYPGNVGLSLRFERVAIGAAWRLGGSGYLHVTADYWLVKEGVATNLDFYVGPGLNLGIADPFILGIRLPVGLQWMPARSVEIFGVVAPRLYVIPKTDFDMNAAIGIRFVL